MWQSGSSIRKSFSRKSGPEKQYLQYGKGQIVFAQGEEADRVFYIQSGKIKLTVVSEQGKEAVVAISGGCELFRRRMSEWSRNPRFNSKRNGRLPDHFNNAEGDARDASQGSQSFQSFS